MAMSGGRQGNDLRITKKHTLSPVRSIAGLGQVSYVQFKTCPYLLQKFLRRLTLHAQLLA